VFCANCNIVIHLLQGSVDVRLTWCRLGAYLLYITWSDRQVFGSPFKVTVLPPSVSETAAVATGTGTAVGGTTTAGAGGGGGSGTSMGRVTGSAADMVESSRMMESSQTTTSRSTAAAGFSNVCHL